MDQLIEYTNNHLLLVTGTIAMALAVVFYEIRLQANRVSALSSAQAVRLINRGARIIDIRDKVQFDSGHIVDSINIPAPELDVGNKRLKNAKTIILICDNGLKSRQSIAALKKGGLEDIFSLQGGLSAWRQDNLPVVLSDNNK